MNAGTGLSFDKDGKLNVDFPTATADSAGVVKPGKGLDVATDGTLTVNYETAKNELAKGKVSSNTILVNRGTVSEGSTFNDVALEIKGGTEAGQVLTSDAAGNVTWTTPEKVATTNTLEAKEDKLVSTVNNVKSELTLAGDVVLKDGETVVGGIQGTPVSETKPVEGQTLVFNTTTNTWEPGTPNVDVANVGGAGNLTTDGIILVDTDKTSSEGSLLKAAKLYIKAGGITANELGNNAVTSDKIKDGAVTPGKVEGGNDGEVLTTTGTGKDAKVEWKTPEKPTVIKGGDSTTSNVVVTPGTGDKANEYTVDVKAAMPKVFYMPPVMFDTSDKAKYGEEQSRNLYEEYVAMFGGTDAIVDMNGRPLMVQSDATAKIPTYKADELNFFVPYYDPAVFSGVKVDANGKLTYKVNKKAKYGAFMTVVFVVK